MTKTTMALYRGALLDDEGMARVPKPVGAWNIMEIRLEGARTVVAVNGSTITDYDGVSPVLEKVNPTSPIAIPAWIPDISDCRCMTIVLSSRSKKSASARCIDFDSLSAEKAECGIEKDLLIPNGFLLSGASLRLHGRSTHS